MPLEVHIPKRAFNSVYLPYLNCSTRFLIFYGGAGSGKSYFVAERYLYRLMTEPMCNLLVVRAVDKTNRDSTFALLKQVINKWGLKELFKINEGDMRIVCKETGNGVIFKGMADVETLKSITFEKGILTDVWIEEATEIDEADFDQLNARLRGKGSKKQIILSFNPISANHWLKKRFFDKKYADNITVCHTTYRNNDFLDEEYKAELESYKDTDPYFYDVYCLGRWGVYGKTVFDAHKINEQIDKNTQPIKTGCFLFNGTDRPKFVAGDYIKIYEEPIPGHPYVMGGDTAGEGSDSFTGHVIDNSNGKQVAVLKHQFDEDMYAEQMYCLGMHYNKALICIETNFSTFPIKELQRLKYPKLFVRKKEDTYTGKIEDSYGFKTTSVTRPLIIANLVKITRENPEWIVDLETLDEMLTFVRNEKGRAEAQQGAHDDLVMGLAIAYYAGQQQTKEVRVTDKKVKYTKEMMKDYRRASKQDKELLRKLWGEPK
jgi:phage terminase large subunit